MTGNPLGMSTAWNAATTDDGGRMVSDIIGLGFRALEVEYRVGENAVSGIAEAVSDGRIRVLSVHNFAPLPATEKPSNWGGDTLSLASDDEAERTEAVKLTLRSLDLARSLGAQALILHMGEVKIGRRYFKEISEMVKAEGVSSPGAVKLREDITEVREAERGRFLEAAIRSLKDLLDVVDDSGVRICIENRYFYHQIPLPEEVAEIKRNIPSSGLCYWHDIGHAHVLEVLGFRSHMESLRLLKASLFGMHIHDSVFIDDHRAPGTGEIDFESVFAEVDPPIKILELASSVTERDIRLSLRHLRGLGIHQ